MNAETTRTCNVCRQAKALNTDFYQCFKRGAIQYGYTCKKCATARACANQAAKKKAKGFTQSGYPWPPLSDLDVTALREWKCITRTGQLRPIVKVELEAA